MTNNNNFKKKWSLLIRSSVWHPSMGRNWVSRGLMVGCIRTLPGTMTRSRTERRTATLALSLWRLGKMKSITIASMYLQSGPPNTWKFFRGTEMWKGQEGEEPALAEKVGESSVSEHIWIHGDWWPLLHISHQGGTHAWGSRHLINRNLWSPSICVR
jgi:hypothetical protein